MLAYAKYSTAYIYKVHFHDAEKTLDFTFEKQEFDIKNRVYLSERVVSLFHRGYGSRTDASCMQAAKSEHFRGNLSQTYYSAPDTSKIAFRLGHDKVLTLFV